jgi:phage shock protein A
MSGIGEEMGDVGMAIQRAEDKTAQMQARAGAIDELIASGALEDASAINAGDDISRELEQMSSASDVELELARLKGLSAPAAPDALEAGAEPAAPAEEPEAAPTEEEQPR